MTAHAELHAAWRKSSHSGGDTYDCVEVAFGPARVALRDSKLPDGGHLALSPSAFRALLAHVVRET